MDLANVLDLDYETQYFGFHPRAFVDGVYNKFYENLFNALNCLSSYLCEVNADEVSPEIIKKNTDDLFQNIVKVLDKCIDLLEMYVTRNVITIPCNAVLPEDYVHVTQNFTQEDEHKLDEDIDNLIQQIIKERARKEVLKSAIANQKIVKGELINTLETLEDLSSSIQRSHLTKEDLDAAKMEIDKCCDGMKQLQEFTKSSL